MAYQCGKIKTSRLTSLAIVMLVALHSKGQPPRYAIPNYIAEHSDRAVSQMILFKIPASVILAQAIIESRSGTSELAKRANNHFGIKCHNQWIGDTILKDDDHSDECFRKYENISDSYRDHSVFLSSRPWYSFLFKLPVDDYKSWCYGLKAAGYATAPNYAEDLIRLIEENRLHELDAVEKLAPIQLTQRIEPELKPFAPYAKHMLHWALAKSEHLFADPEDLFFPSLILLGAPSPLEQNPIAER